MSQTSDSDAFSVDALLRIEAICDQFEDDIKCGNRQSLESYWRDAPPTIQARLRAELERIEAAQAASDRVERTFQGDASVVEAMQTRQSSSGRGPTSTSAGTYLNRRFELVTQIGSGGNGAVWKARDHELRRWVAVKIPHRATIIDTDRFFREARSAAQLQHPNIVRVHEVGDDHGTCFLVSELIEGDSLAELLQRDPLELPEAISLLAKVVEAIAYAHQMGVVHRDLKPQNILLDEARQPYVTDFGIAKNANLDDATLTMDGQLLGTPAYMAPEQARGASNEADERTDVYSLGVVLFKLLTGDVPFHGSLDSVVYQVIHLDAPTPRRWNRDVPRDLETICLRCLQKSPTRRFDSAGDLLDELTRYLEGRPIRSRPTSLAGQAAKWVRRNPRLATLATASAVLLVTVAVGSMVAAVLLNHARAEEAAAKSAALAAQRVAETEANVSRESVAFLESTFETTDPVAWVLSGQAGGDPPDDKVRLARSAERIRHELQGQPLARARLMDILGNACRGVGLLAEAETLLLDAAEIREAHAGSYARDQLHAARGKNLYYRAWLEHDRGGQEEAEALYQTALQEIAASGGAESLLAADIEFHLGRLLLERQRNEEAATRFAHALQIRSQLLPASSRLITAAKLGLQFSRTPVGGLPPLTQIAMLLQGEDWGSDIGSDYAMIMFYRQQRDYASACGAYQKLLDRLRHHLGDPHPLCVLARGDYAGLLYQAGNYREAYPLAREVLAAGRTLAPKNPHMRNALLRMASETLQAGRVDEAHDYYREVQRTAEPREFSFELAHGLFWTCLAAGRVNEAEEHSRAMCSRIDTYAVEQAAWVTFGHARLLDKIGQPDEAREWDARALAAVMSINGPEYMKHPLWTHRLALICRQAKEFELAETYFQHAFRLEAALRPSNHPRLADRLVPLGRCHLRAGRTAEAVQMLERAYAIRRRFLPMEDPRIEATRKELDRARKASESPAPMPLAD